MKTSWIGRTLAAATLAWVGLPPASADLVGHWSFDEGAGTSIVDSSGQGNHGTVVNAKPSLWTNGVHGAALYFDGTTGAGSSYVTIPDAASLDLTNALSFAAWVRSDDIGRDAPIIAKEGDGRLAYWFGAFGPAHFGMLLDSDGNQPWTILDRDQGFIPRGLWVHLASTWDGTTIRHYLNGAPLTETATFGGPIHAADGPLTIAANVPYNTSAFKGTLDDLRLYNHALSPAELRALAGAAPALVGHWSFDEGNGTNIWDQSSQTNHGTLLNPRTNTWTTGVSGSALYFDGTVGETATYVAIPDAPSLHVCGDVTFSAWIRCDNIRRDAPILAKEGDGKLSYWFGAFGLQLDGSSPGNFGVLLDADGNQPWSLLDRNQGAIPEGEWAHLASVREGATVRHYLNGEPLAQTNTFEGPIYVSDAFLAIGVNSLYTFASRRTAFEGTVDEVRLYNYALSAEEVRALYLTMLFRITSVAPEGDDLRLAWTCVPGRSYVLQTNALLSATGFGDLTVPIPVPPDYAGTSTNFLHAGALRGAPTLYYRVKLLP
jgi:hypothetical protein